MKLLSCFQGLYCCRPETTSPSLQTQQQWRTNNVKKNHKRKFEGGSWKRTRGSWMSSSSAISPSLFAMRALPSPLRVWINGAGKAGEKEGTTRGVCSHQAPLESARKSPRTDLQRRIPEVVVVRRRIGGVSKRRDLSGRVYASDAARAYASGRAELIESELRGEFPSFVKPMLQSHTSGGFWLGLARHFCTKHLPRRDSTVTLIDENGEETDTVYLTKQNGLSGGWRGFSLDHELVDGDALVFQLINPTAFMIYIVRTSGYGSK